VDLTHLARSRDHRPALVNTAGAVIGKQFTE
jgi:hypothetical protein